MAKLFKFPPWVVDEIDFESVLGMLSMEAHTRKREQQTMKNGRKF